MKCEVLINLNKGDSLKPKIKTFCVSCDHEERSHVNFETATAKLDQTINEFLADKMKVVSIHDQFHRNVYLTPTEVGTGHNFLVRTLVYEEAEEHGQSKAAA